jgi:hypothetical protein
VGCILQLKPDYQNASIQTLTFQQWLYILYNYADHVKPPLTEQRFVQLYSMLYAMQVCKTPILISTSSQLIDLANSYIEKPNLMPNSLKLTLANVNATFAAQQAYKNVKAAPPNSGVTLGTPIPVLGSNSGIGGDPHNDPTITLYPPETFKNQPWKFSPLQYEQTLDPALGGFVIPQPDTGDNRYPFDSSQIDYFDVLEFGTIAHPFGTMKKPYSPWYPSTVGIAIGESATNPHSRIPATILLGIGYPLPGSNSQSGKPAGP